MIENSGEGCSPVKGGGNDMRAREGLPTVQTREDMHYSKANYIHSTLHKCDKVMVMSNEGRYLSLPLSVWEMPPDLP